MVPFPGRLYANGSVLIKNVHFTKYKYYTSFTTKNPPECIKRNQPLGQQSCILLKRKITGFQITKRSGFSPNSTSKTAYQNMNHHLQIAKSASLPNLNHKHAAFEQRFLLFSTFEAPQVDKPEDFTKAKSTTVQLKPMSEQDLDLRSICSSPNECTSNTKSGTGSYPDRSVWDLCASCCICTPHFCCGWGPYGCAPCSCWPYNLCRCEYGSGRTGPCRCYCSPLGSAYICGPCGCTPRTCGVFCGPCRSLYCQPGLVNVWMPSEKHSDRYVFSICKSGPCHYGCGNGPFGWGPCPSCAVGHNAACKLFLPCRRPHCFRTKAIWLDRNKCRWRRTA